MKKTKVKKRVVNIKRLSLVLLFLFVISFIIYLIIDIPITNIYIIGNKNLSDIEIIRKAKLIKYPETFLNSSSTIKKRLEKEDLIKNAKVYKKYLTIVYIEIEENTPLFYDEVTNTTFMKEQKEIKKYLYGPRLVNSIPKDLHNKLKEEMSKIKPNIINKISSIRFYPNKEIDPNRFLLIMNDSNYVYLTLGKFDKLNKYLEIVNSLSGKKGIIYLDSGSSFTEIKP